MGGVGNSYRILSENVERKDRVCREIYRKIDLKETETGIWAGFIWLKILTSSKFF
jgi:hypothetical protein